MTADNQKAQEIFTSTPKGRDTPDEVFFETQVMFREIPDIAVFTNSATGDKLPESMMLFITKNAIGITLPSVLIC